MPIITCAGKNKVGKVAAEITSKGYCSTKNMYYSDLNSIQWLSAGKGQYRFLKC